MTLVILGCHYNSSPGGDDLGHPKAASSPGGPFSLEGSKATVTRFTFGDRDPVIRSTIGSVGPRAHLTLR
jgi:hypothetical protein